MKYIIPDVPMKDLGILEYYEEPDKKTGVVEEKRLTHFRLQKFLKPLYLNCEVPETVKKTPRTSKYAERNEELHPLVRLPDLNLTFLAERKNQF